MRASQSLQGGLSPRKNTYSAQPLPAFGLVGLVGHFGRSAGQLIRQLLGQLLFANVWARFVGERVGQRNQIPAFQADMCPLEKRVLGGQFAAELFQRPVACQV